MISLCIIAFWAALLSSTLLAIPIFRGLLAVKSRQTVSQYAPEGHAKKQGTPTMGGLIIVSGTLVSLCACHLWASSALFFAFTLIGFVDDFVIPRLMPGKRGLEWKQKLALQLIAAGVYAFVASQDPWLIGVSLFVILFYSNAYNFSDGLDALAGSILIFLGLGIAAIGFTIGNNEPALISLALIGAVIPFLYLNAPPAKIFMGDVGSLPIGALLGAAVVKLGSRPMTFPTLYLALLVLSFVMVVELVPVPLQILSVKLRKKRLFPFTPIHHAFEKAGEPETRVVWRFALVQLIASLAALTIVATMTPGL